MGNSNTGREDAIEWKANKYSNIFLDFSAMKFYLFVRVAVVVNFYF